MEVQLFEDWVRLKRHGAWPVSGGVLEQAPTFVEAIDIIDRECARLEERAAKTVNEEAAK